MPFLKFGSNNNVQATIYVDKNGNHQTTFDTDLSYIDSEEIIQIGYYEEALTKKIKVPKMPENILKVPETLPLQITSLKSVFKDCADFNQDISKWDVSNVQDVSFMFYNASSFDQDISKWNVDSQMYFYSFSIGSGFENDNFKQPHFTRSQPTIYIDKNDKQQKSNEKDLSSINTKKIIQIGFYERTRDEIVVAKMPISILEVPQVLPVQIALLDLMFSKCNDFNQDLSNWDTSNIVSMGWMFNQTQSFNGNISTWNVSNLNTAFYMFEKAKKFNQDLSKWNTKNIFDMNSMFHEAELFNQDISKWNTSQVYDMNLMFKDAKSFDQDLSKWNVDNVIKHDQFAKGSGIEDQEKKLPKFQNI